MAGFTRKGDLTIWHWLRLFTFFDNNTFKRNHAKAVEITKLDMIVKIGQGNFKNMIAMLEAAAKQ